MIQESYVTFEQAKALKELEFPQGVNTTLQYFIKTGEKMKYLDNGEGYDDYLMDRHDLIECPTLSLVQKRLREEKDLFITIGLYDNGLCYCEYYQNGDFIDCIKYFETYEQALSTGIDKCIEILKIKH